MDPHFHAGLDDEEARRQAHGVTPPKDVSEAFMLCWRAHLTLIDCSRVTTDNLPSLLSAGANFAVGIAWLVKMSCQQSAAARPTAAEVATVLDDLGITWDARSAVIGYLSNRGLLS